MTDYEANRLAPTGDPFLSPSRMEKIDTCLRAFGLRYTDNIRAPDKPSAAFGKVVHFKQQIYIITGVMPEPELVQVGAKKIDAGRVAIAGLRFLPLPHPSIRTEHEFEYEAFPGIWFQGKIDVYDPTRVMSQHVRDDGSTYTAAYEIGPEDQPWDAYDSKGRPIPLVIDHKTTGDFKWQKSAEALRATLDFKGDPQTGFYGEYAVREFIRTYGEPPEAVHFRWVYYLRSEDEHKARTTDLRLTPAEIREVCNRWKENAEHAITLTRSKISGHDLPANLNGCSKFGGCEFGPPTRSSPGNLNICRLSAGERMRSAMTTTSIPLSEQVRLAMAGNTAAAPAAGNPFQSPQSPEASAANPFGIAAPNPAPAASAPNPFQNAAPPAGNPFAAFQPAPAAAPPAASAPNPFAAFQAPAAAPPAIDPRLAECHPSIDPSQRAMFLAHCDKNGLDHRTGQPKGASPATVPAAPATQPNEAEAFRALAQRMYAEKRRPDASTHPEVARLFSALETINGPIAAPAEPPKKRGRPKKIKTDPVTGAVTEEDDDSPQIVITVKAIDEVIAFLQSLKTSAPQ